jgi:hypothetical protein
MYNAPRWPSIKENARGAAFPDLAPGTDLGWRAVRSQWLPVPRKVHQYGDGQLECTARVALELRASLSPEPVPAVADIDAQDEFTVLPLTPAEFEAVWDRVNEAE